MSSDQKRAIIAVLLSVGVLFTWQMFFAPEQQSVILNNQNTQTENLQAKNTTGSNETVSGVNENIQNSEERNLPDESEQTKKKELFSLSNNNHRVDIGNDFSLMNFETDNAVYKLENVLESENPFIVFVKVKNQYQKIFFDFEKVSENELRGRNKRFSIDLSIKLTDNGKTLYSLNSAYPYLLRFQIDSKKSQMENKQFKEVTYFSSENVERKQIGESFSTESKIKWFAIDYNYHIFATVFQDKENVLIHSNEAGLSQFDLVRAVDQINFEVIFSKKNYNQLKSFGNQLDLSIDFGWVGLIAVPTLKILQFIHEYLPNYGLAIIVLTILFKLVTFPLQFKSYKSMKKMQIVQPELNKLREKYKDDPQRMQKETMELFKRAGANPLGGCLPLLIQMPFFFALYKVLYNAVELVDSPFVFWITDLSQKDPYYVLPILMGITMFLQQKMTPATTADPNQKKIMMIMPVVFSFFMKDLPAGLNLYIFISTAFSIVQQSFVYKMTK